MSCDVRPAGYGNTPCRNRAVTVKPAWNKAGYGKRPVTATPFKHARVHAQARGRAHASEFKTIRNHAFAVTSQCWCGFQGYGWVTDEGLSVTGKVIRKDKP